MHTATEKYSGKATVKASAEGLWANSCPWRFYGISQTQTLILPTKQF